MTLFAECWREDRATVSIVRWFACRCALRYRDTVENSATPISRITVQEDSDMLLVCAGAGRKGVYTSRAKAQKFCLSYLDL
jgi:hypothetical protein